ncbi:hypothetical protein KM868_10865 [Micrococcus luteus]|uniref:hypothetical protein n=1 Tax=Micrococcus TaxID=1269 RepID=UPI001072A415|nr:MULTISPECIES: hypothetical protein [Micrococcus]EBV8528775.1 hypothetical protein [Salmonella enterica subsp. enterica serovar Typhimurium]MBF0745624.1 hypothetical protein [Micrococcus yunnanensis]MBU8763997.1 hypothetical protein [Micrococcus luteus]TFU54140.1 hypothetical protein E4T95_09355 [Micrococcus yunnanensis]
MDNAFATWIQVIASLLSVILALVGLVIARDASREARSNRDFQLDRSVGDEFAIAVSALSLAGREDGLARSDFARQYGDAVRLWSDRVTSPRAQRQRGEVEAFLRKLGHTAEQLLPALPTGHGTDCAHGVRIHPRSRATRHEGMGIPGATPQRHRRGFGRPC